MATEPGSETTIPLVEENVAIGKRKVERDRVLVHKSVQYKDEVIELPAEREELSIERIAIGRAVSEAPAVREEGGTLIVPVLEERLVVEKQLFLVEEVRISRTRTQQTARQTVRLRREDVRIERLSACETPGKED